MEKKIEENGFGWSILVGAFGEGSVASPASGTTVETMINSFKFCLIVLFVYSLLIFFVCNIFYYFNGFFFVPVTAFRKSYLSIYLKKI